MKSILFFIPTLSGGGAEKVLVNLINNLDSEKYTITVKTLFNTGVNKKYLNENIEFDYVFNNYFKGYTYFLKFFSPKLLYKLLVSNDYDVAVSYLEGPTTRIISGAPSTTISINWIHNEFKEVNDLSFAYRSKKETVDCYGRYDYTVFVADTARFAFPKNIQLKNSLTLYNTIESTKIKKLSNELVTDFNFKKNTLNLISVGRFTKQKGYERLLNVIQRLIIEDQSNIHLLLIGEGELVEEYKKIIKEKDLAKNVTLVGYKENPYKYIKSADLFVCSSLHEGFSTVITESLIVGTPVIATRCSGMTELLGDNNQYGVVVENNEEELYVGLRRLIKNNEILAKYKERALMRGEIFDKKETIEATEKFLDSI